MAKQYVVKDLGNRNFRLAALKPGVVLATYLRKEAEAGRKASPCKGVPPSLATLKQWTSDCVARATDGCRVEPDGVCDHGHPSWMLALGYI
jgi:hypothetical protein